MRNRLARTGLAAVLLVCAPALPTQAQQRPNFSGTWKQNNERTTPAGIPDRLYTETIEHVGDLVSVHSRSVDIPTISVSDRSFSTGGSKLQGSRPAGREYTTTARWQGPALVVETVTHGAGGAISTMREIWILSDDGRTLTRTTHVKGPEGESDARIVLEKQ